MRLFGDRLSRGTRLILIGLFTLALLLVAYSIYSAATVGLGWLFLACFTVLTGLFPVRLPFVTRRTSPSITVSDVFVFLAILLYSPEVAVLIAVLDGVLVGLRSNRAKIAERMPYNLSQLAISTWLVGHLFYGLMEEMAPLAARTFSESLDLFLNLGLCSVLHFALNALAVAVGVMLWAGVSVRKVFVEHLLWGLLTSVVGAAGAGVIFIIFRDSPIFALGVTVPMVLILFHAYRMYVRRIEQAQRHLSQLDDLYQSTITSLAMAIDAKDQEAHGNVEKVKVMALGLARRLGVTDELTLKGLRAAALLHDVGKLAVPEYILNKPGKLTASEVARIRSHPGVGADILETVPFPYPVAPFVRYHHERWDGEGYPEGLKGKDIPLGARILSLVDCYFGLRSDRPFQPKLNRELALNLIKHEAGTAFDPLVVETFLASVDELESEADELGEALNYPSLKMKPKARKKDAHPLSISGTVFHDIASTYKEMQAVYEISQTIGRSLSVTDTLSHLSARIKRFVPYASCVIYLVNSEDDRVLPHHVSGMYKGILEGVEVRLGEGVTGWVAAHNKPLTDVSPEPDFPRLETLKAV
ncbi:MAG: HD domain-containing protein, partial [Acidobacteriota bacterium]